LVAAYVLALGNGTEVDLNLGHGQDVSRSRHVLQELCKSPIRRQHLPHKFHIPRVPDPAPSNSAATAVPYIPPTHLIIAATH